MKKRIKIIADNYLIDDSAGWWRKEEPQLIKLARKDPRALGKLFDHYYDDIYNYLLHRTANVLLARELASSTFYQVFRKLSSFRWRNIPFSAWLYRIASKAANRHFRKYKNFKTRTLEDRRERLSGEMSETEREIRDAEQRIARDTRFVEIHRYIAVLKPAHQEVIVLRYFEHKNISDIARILGRREAGVKSFIQMAGKKLRSTMEQLSYPGARGQKLSAETLLENLETANPPRAVLPHSKAQLKHTLLKKVF